MNENEINEKNKSDENKEPMMVKIQKYGRWWYTTKKEAEKAKRSDETIYFDDGMNAYYIRKTQKPFWRF